MFVVKDNSRWNRLREEINKEIDWLVNAEDAGQIENKINTLQEILKEMDIIEKEDKEKRQKEQKKDNGVDMWNI